jgi:hypothetical protein
VSVGSRPQWGVSGEAGHRAVDVLDAGGEADLTSGKTAAVGSSKADLCVAIQSPYVRSELKGVRNHFDPLGQRGVLTLIEAHGPANLTRVSDPILELAQGITEIIAAEGEHHCNSLVGSRRVTACGRGVTEPLLS